ncbi:UNVERIFIED_ORG: MORN repeat protein [Chitinophaga ginsengisegetis]
MQIVKPVSYCIIIFLTTFTSCQQKKEIRETFFPDGKLESRIVALSKEDIKYTSYYKTGSIASEGELDRDLAKQGAWKYFYPDGKIAAFGEYNDELRVGTWTYKLKDTAFTIEWETYINRPLKLNLPKGWIINENIAADTLLTAYTADGSILRLSVSLVEKGNEPFDSLVVKGTRDFNKTFPLIQGSITDAIINSIKSKKVVQYVGHGEKKLKIYRLYVPGDNVICLLSFILQQPEKEPFYTKIIEEIVTSFEII